MIFQTNKGYPTPNVERKNTEYAKILLQDYAGMKSEETAINLYIFQALNSQETYKEFAGNIEKIAIVEMRHLDLLGQTIKLLGLEPKYSTYCTDNTEIPWTSTFIAYKNSLKEMLEVNIKGESSAIEHYEIHREIIDDKYIKALLDRIIEDEYLHLNYFIDLYNTLL